MNRNCTTPSPGSKSKGNNSPFSGLSLEGGHSHPRFLSLTQTSTQQIHVVDEGRSNVKSPL